MNEITSAKNKPELFFPESKVMHLMRSFAIFSVICAHCAIINDHSVLFDYTFYQILTAFGILGVPIFFFSSGYFFYINQRRDYKSFLSHKIKTFFIPWIVATTFAYLYVALRKGGLNFKDYTYFIIGINNYTYFLTVLLIFFLAMLKSKYSMQFIFICVILSVTSLILTTAGVFETINPYCNPLNWLIYFIIGILFQKHNLLRDIALLAKKYIDVTLIIFIALNIAFVVFRMKVNYWSIGGYLYIFIGFYLLLGIISKYHTYLTKLVPIGKESMTIFLIHSPFAGILVYLTNRFDLWFVLPFRPFIILFAVLLLIRLYKKFAIYFNIENLCYPLIGLSNK
jgi:surface polysaccharide O-acyltransferase-like enzyme